MSIAKHPICTKHPTSLKRLWSVFLATLEEKRIGIGNNAPVFFQWVLRIHCPRRTLQFIASCQILGSCSAKRRPLALFFCGIIGDDNGIIKKFLSTFDSIQKE